MRSTSTGEAGRALRTAILAFLAVAAGVPPVAAQEGPPLRKSDLVHALVARSPDEAAAIIRRRCLSFRPTELDLEDLRALGADEEVIGAIRECMEGAGRDGEPSSARAAEAAASRAEAPRPAAGDRRPSPPSREFTLFLTPQDVVLPTGREVPITAQVTSGAEPVPGLLVTLHEQGEPVGDRIVATARTDERGTVDFRVPVGHTPGLQRYVLRVKDRSLIGRNVVLVQVVPTETGYEAAVARESGSRRGPGYEPASARADTPGGEPARESGGDIEEETADREVRLSRLEEHLGGVRRDLDSLAETRAGLGVSYALHLARHGRYDAATAELVKLDARKPGRTDVLEARGYVSLWRGDVAEAVERFRELVRRRPEDPGAWEGLGRALSAAGRGEEAAEAFGRARRLRP